MFNYLNILLLLCGALILGITIYFLVQSNRKLSQTLKESKQKLGIAPKKSYWDKFSLSADESKNPSFIPNVSNKNTFEPLPKTKKVLQHEPHAPLSPVTIVSLKDAVLHQQQTLTELLQKIEELESTADNKNSYKENTDALEEKIEQLELELVQKEREIKKFKQQEELTQQMASRMDDVNEEFAMLQQKITALEKQASDASALLQELEDAKEQYRQLQNDLETKQQKLNEVIAENQQLRQALHKTEDALAEANGQQQQLLVKVQLLQDLNNDLEGISTSNKKLKNDLRRIGKLESMLSIIAEDKDRR